MTESTTHPSSENGMPLHDVRTLCGPDMRAGLILDGVLYILRITRSGKLILTK